LNGDVFIYDKIYFETYSFFFLFYVTFRSYFILEILISTFIFSLFFSIFLLKHTFLTKFFFFPPQFSNFLDLLCGFFNGLFQGVFILFYVTFFIPFILIFLLHFHIILLVFSFLMIQNQMHFLAYNLCSYQTLSAFSYTISLSFEPLYVNLLPVKKNLHVLISNSKFLLLFKLFYLFLLLNTIFSQALHEAKQAVNKFIFSIYARVFKDLLFFKQELHLLLVFLVL
jgi:hypothetical protein